MRVLYFGTYERAYPRNAQVISALRRAGVDVAERHVSVWDEQEHKFGAGVVAAARLARGEVALLRRQRDDFDALIVGYPGHFDLPAAKRAARGRPIVFNPLVSLWDTFVEDRARFGPSSVAARALRAIDRAAFRAADLVVADTEAHAALFRELGARNVHVVFVGAEERIFTPERQMQEPFTALFYGKLGPLHGVEAILAAATLAPDLRFRIIGTGQLDTAAVPPNVERVPWIPYEQLPSELHRCGCALGIFGTTAKAARVIPNKVFQALACGAPVVTADTTAVRELGSEGMLLVPAGDPRALADAVRSLAADRPGRERLAAAGREAYERKASEAILGRQWRASLESLL